MRICEGDKVGWWEVYVHQGECDMVVSRVKLVRMVMDKHFATKVWVVKVPWRGGEALRGKGDCDS